MAGGISSGRKSVTQQTCSSPSRGDPTTALFFVSSAAFLRARHVISGFDPRPWTKITLMTHTVSSTVQIWYPDYLAPLHPGRAEAQSRPRRRVPYRGSGSLFVMQARRNTLGQLVIED